MFDRTMLIAHVQEHYGIAPDYPWARTPHYAIFRHTNSRKWFGAIVDITADKLGLPGKDVVDALNVKCDPMLIGSMLRDDGVFPAYHMNKEHWISVLLNGTVPAEKIISLLELSYDLTK